MFDIVRIKTRSVACLPSPFIETTCLIKTSIRRVLCFSVFSKENYSKTKTLKNNYAIDCEISDEYRDIVDFCDLAIIATPNSSHYEIASYLLQRKIHTLVEKPLTIDPKKADDLCQIAERNNCLLSVGFVTRFFPSTILMKEMIEKISF